MLGDKKQDAFESLVSEWIGEIGQLNIQVANNTTAINNFIYTVMPIALQKAEDTIQKYDARGEKLYAHLLEADAAIVLSSQKIAGKMDLIHAHAGEAVDAMLSLTNAITCKNGISERTNNIANILESKTAQLTMAVNALKEIQTSKISRHEKAISAIVIFVGMVAGFVGGVVAAHAF
jgi:hypothetical protein